MFYYPLYLLSKIGMIMNYFVTIYTDPFIIDYDFTHTFISLTHKSPDELEQQDDKWYLKLYPSILDSNNDEGFFGFGACKVRVSGIPGKIFENNHYKKDCNESYSAGEVRSWNTFKTICVLKLSAERYNHLFNKIKKEIQETQHITSESKIEDNNPKYEYNLTGNNCTQWVQRMLNEIGVEQYLFHQDYVTIPDKYVDLYFYIHKTNDIIYTMSLIDKNLSTVNGANTVKFWMRANFYNLHDIKSKNIPNFLLSNVNKNIFDVLFSIYEKKEADKLISSLFNQYTKLKKYIDNLCQKDADSYCTGTFHFIYVDNGQLKIMKPENGYVPETLQELDASKPYNNYTLGKYLYFIFIPDEEYEYIYHKYNYGQVDKEYNQSINECYKQVLLGNTDNMKYYSQSLNKLLDKQKSNTFHQV